MFQVVIIPHVNREKVNEHPQTVVYAHVDCIHEDSNALHDAADKKKEIVLDIWHITPCNKTTRFSHGEFT